MLDVWLTTLNTPTDDKKNSYPHISEGKICEWC